MKKTVAMLMICVMLLISVAAGADTFTFRNGITWGMSKAEVMAKEGLDFKEETTGTYTYLWTDDVVQLSDYTAVLQYYFKDDSICWAGYSLLVDAEMVAVLLNAFNTKYGMKTDGDSQELTDIMSKCVPGGITDPSHDCVLCKWDAAENTQIWMIYDPESYELPEK